MTNYNINIIIPKFVVIYKFIILNVISKIKTNTALAIQLGLAAVTKNENVREFLSTGAAFDRVAHKVSITLYLLGLSHLYSTCYIPQNFPLKHEPKEY